MAKRMLIDATHPEETRVVVLNGNRLEEFDFETSTKKQVKGNIYLAKVTRVEPSLQAAFVEYGGNRQGFLAFSEIHADYYRIPVADRRGAGTEYQHAEMVRSETAGEAADESGVPLEDALPEPVRVVDNDPTHDDPTDIEPFFEPGYATAEEREAAEPVRHGEVNHDIHGHDIGGGAPWGDGAPLDAAAVSGPPPAEAEPAPLAQTASLSDETADRSGRAESYPAGVEPISTPARTWGAASAGDDMVSAPQDLAIERDTGQSIAVVPDDGQPDPSYSRGRNEDFETPAPSEPATVEPAFTVPDIIEPAPIEVDYRIDGFAEARPPAQVGHHFDDITEARGRDDGEHRDSDNDRPIAAGVENLEADGFQWAISSDEEQSEAADFAERRTAEEGESDPAEARHRANGEGAESEVIETLGGDEFEEVETQRSRVHRHYKIQEVIKRRQIMLVQVTKEERGNKGAALTTYLSLAGRYCVLMPNTARGGGVSRKITNLSDRRRLKEILEELEIPEGMGVIVRTAGAERSKAEIKRDYEYLLRLWNEIRELTLRSTAPALIYEEGDLIKRSIRDLYTRDIDEVLVEGEDGYRTAKAFMKMLMPSHAKRVQPYRDPQIGLLHRFQVESQIDAIHSPVVQLRSGGYVVIDQTEALVAIDVNSGRATRERNIEETALRTNLEAAEEIARQLRLRDLAGLIVIDFIDMEEHRNQAAVERRLKEALRNDRARIQVGRISPFGLLEMSRQRLRSSLTEASTQPCPHCGGTGFIRSTESTALYVLRSIEEEGMRHRVAEVCVYVPTTVALYILNHKRESLAQLETRYGIHVLVARDDTLIPPAFRLERLRAIEPGEVAAMAPAPLTQALDIEDDEAEEDLDEASDNEDSEANGRDGEDERGRGRRRRRRRRRHEEERIRPPAASGDDDAEEPEIARAAVTAAPEASGEPEDDDDSEAARLRRRRGRRGGRRRGRRDEGVGPGSEIGRAAADNIEIVPVDADRSGHAAEFDELDAAVAAHDERWSRSAGLEPSLSLAGSAIETASLPALAGDEAGAAAPFAAAESEIASLPALAEDATAPETPPTAALSAAIEIETAGLPGLAGEGAAAEATPSVLMAANEIGMVSPPAIDEEEMAEPAHLTPFAATEVETASLPVFAGEDVVVEPHRYALTAATEIETASSRALADEGTAAEPAIDPAAEPVEASPATTTAANDVVPPTWQYQALRGAGEVPSSESPLFEPVEGAGEPSEPNAERSNGHDAAIAEAAPAADAAGEPDLSAEPDREPSQIVREVTSKPENPRRGWWQRLIQS